MKKLLFIGFLCLFLINCEDNHASNCSGGICTNIFITLNVSVQDSSGNAVALDNFEIRDRDTNENITIRISESELQSRQLTGEFPIYNDSFVSANQSAERNLEFKGFVDGTLVAEGDFIVDSDCCHVSLVSESNVILVN